MKRTFTLSALALIVIGAAALLSPFAASGQEKNTVFTDASELSVRGKICDDTFEQYSRLPAGMQGTVSDALWRLGRCSAGIYVRFTSDAGAFEFRWGSVLGAVLDNVSLIATRGMALYVRDGKGWSYVGTARPNRNGLDNVSTVNCPDLEGAQHEYLLYLSLYDGVKDLSIGVAEGRFVRKPELPLPADDRPVILYGTSLTQGASASNPGMAGSNRLSRLLDRTVINQGFSGNGKLDPAMAELMAAYDTPAAYVIDNWNGTAQLGEERLEAFIATLRKAHPSTPVVLIDRAMQASCTFNAKSRSIVADMDSTIDAIYRKLKKAGDRNIYHIRLSVLGDDNSGTIDGDHFTDESFRIWAAEAYKVLRRVCR